MSGAPPGQRDYSFLHLSQHALARFVERFAAEPATAARELRRALARTRRLGRNPMNGAIAVLALYRSQVLVAIVQETTCSTRDERGGCGAHRARAAQRTRTVRPRQWTAPLTKKRYKARAMQQITGSATSGKNNAFTGRNRNHARPGQSAAY
jgi:hypothetical protein